MQNYKQISIIIPTYNRADKIHSCLKSIFIQSYSHFEVIVVDDCSTDDTITVLNRINDKRLKIFKLKTKKGAQAARNFGIQNSSFEWIAFQDSDDEWLPNKLELQIKELEKVKYHPFILIYGDCYIKYYDSENIKKWERPILQGDDIYKDILMSSPPMYQSILTSKLALEKIGYLDEKVEAHQEWDTSISLAKFCRFIHIDEPLFVYKLNSCKSISSNYLQDINSYYYIILKNKNDIINIWNQKGWHKQLMILYGRSLNFKLWRESDFFFNELNQLKVLNIKLIIYRILRVFKLSPSCFVRKKK